MNNNRIKRDNINSRKNTTTRRESSSSRNNPRPERENSNKRQRDSRSQEKESRNNGRDVTPPTPPAGNNHTSSASPESPGNIGASSYYSTSTPLLTPADEYSGGILGEFRNLDEDLIDAIVHSPEQTVQNSDLYQGSKRIYNTYEATLGYVSAQMSYDSARDAYQSHIDKIDTLGINRILDESIGGQISFSNTFDNVEAANFIQQNGTFVHLVDGKNNDTDIISFQNELIYNPSEQSYLLDRIIRGETITFYSSDKKENILIDSSSINVIGDNGQRISLQEYGHNLSRAYKGKSNDEISSLKQQFEDDFHKLALHQTTYKTDDLGQMIAEQVFYGATVDADMNYIDNISMYLGGHSTSDITAPFREFVGDKKHRDNIKINIRGGVDLTGSTGRIVKTASSNSYDSIKASSDNIVTSYLNGAKQRNMTEEAFSFADMGQTGKGRNVYNLALESTILDREMEQYVDYLSHHLNIDLAQNLKTHTGVLSLGHNYHLMSADRQKQELERALSKAGASMSDIKHEDTQKILDAFISANNAKYRQNRAKDSRKRSSSALSGFRDEIFKDSDLVQGWNRISSTARNGQRLANLSYNAVHGAVGIVPMQKKLIEGTVSDIAAGKSLKEIHTNRQKTRQIQREEWNNRGLKGANKRRRERNEQRRANLRAVGRTTGRAVGTAVRTSAPVTWMGNTRIGKAARGVGDFTNKHIVSPLKKTFKSIEKIFTNFFDVTSQIKLVIFGAGLVAIAIIMVPPVVSSFILNTVTSTPSAALTSAEAGEFSSLCDEISDKINSYAVRQQNTYVTQVKLITGLEDEDITIHYADKSGMFNYTCSVTDPIPLEYLNIKQTIVAMDLTASGFYSVSYGGEGDDTDEGISDSEAIKLCKDIYKNTHWSSYTTTVNDEDEIIAADIYCVVELAAASVYPSDTDSVNYIGGPLYQAHISSVNNNWLDNQKIDYYSQEVLTIFDSIMSNSWADNLEMEGYDLNVDGWCGTILNTEYSSDDGSGMLWGEYTGERLSTEEINSIIATLTAMGYTDRQLATALFCLQAVGCPYNQSLRMNPGVYDCSSLAARSWDSAGYSELIVSNWAMTAAAEYVYLRDSGKSLADDSNLQPGDLIFYTNNPDRELGIGHVSIYIGEIDGKQMLVSAAGTAYGVIYQEYSGDGVYFARP